MASVYIALVNREGVPDDFTNSTGNIVEGTSSDATADVELRFLTGAGTTKLDLIRAMEIIKRWIIEGGQTTGQDSNLPIY